MKTTKQNLLSLSLLLSVVIFLGAGCSSGSYRSEIQDRTVKNCDELEPDNPYSYESGHYAGFEWAQRNEPSICSGNSNSFIEGCEEFQSQQEDYENCLDR